ncbi:SART-1 protein [Pseudomassariella vexata]|uniref:SART-1 protein n=1 Tax=Pseudomassariella vexata TaxID=1141098 RepID=A0A1Y2DY29_9PEZI|nr:SART-1 protein [Pseudomassariella vexata]ORY64004.1 SART-1 protein [Pseudomassariella vexata]
MNAVALEETNRLRVSLGMKPLPVPGAPGPQFKEATPPSDDGEEAASTLETRQAAAYDNYMKVKDAEDEKKRREEKKAAIKKARDASKRFERLEGKGLGEADDEVDVDAKSWLKSQKKRQKQIDKVRKMEEEMAAAEAAAVAAVQYTSKDLAGVKVAHEITSFEDGDEQILVLKDSNVVGEDDEEGDELENVELREREKLNERLELKKKKPAYDPHVVEETGEINILSQYDEEISGKKSKKFTLNAQGTGSAEIDAIGGQPQNRKLQMINLDIFQDDQPASDYLDYTGVKVKKPKKKSKSTRQRPIDEDDILPLEAEPQDQYMDIDSGAGFVIGKKRRVEDTGFVDDEDLQATLAVQRRDVLKKRKRTRPEDIARQLKEEADTLVAKNEAEEAQKGGLVIDEISEFVSGLKREDIEKRKPRTSKTPNPETGKAMDADSDEDEQMKDADEVEERQHEISTLADIGTAGVEEEKTIASGIGATLKLLRERNLLKESDSGEKNEKLRQQAAFLAEKKRRQEEIEQLARDQRERDRTSGKLDRMSVREREEWARQQNNMRDQQTSRQMVDLFNKSYKPNVELKYHDEHGRSLDKKEAFKHLSHQFHGKGSGKGKTDKYLKKMEDEKRREAQSMLDVSQDVGMSSATAQQTKKRKEAGVRLA